MCFGNGGAQKMADQQRADEVASQGRITNGMSAIDAAFGGFNDAFYKKRADAYSAYAMPQVDRQARNAHDNLIYALSRSGNLDSSAAIKSNADLNDEVNAQRIGIANTGLDQANQLRNQVEGARSSVVSELNATGNSDASSAAALRNVQNLNQPQGYSPIGNLFANFAQIASGIGSNSGNGFSGFSGAGGRSSPSYAKSSQRVVGG